MTAPSSWKAEECLNVTNHSPSSFPGLHTPPAPKTETGADRPKRGVAAVIGDLADQGDLVDFLAGSRAGAATAAAQLWRLM
jgi:hypothetical protein